MSTLQSVPLGPSGRTGQLGYVDRATAQWIYMIGDCVAVPYGAAATGGRFEFMLIDADPGGGPPLHTHAHAEVFVVLDGAFEFVSYVDGELVTLSAGPADVVHAPGGTPHTFRCVGPASGHCLAFVLPGGSEAFFLAAGVAVTPETREAVSALPPNFQRIIAAAQLHGVALWDAAGQAWTGTSAEFFPAAEARRVTRRIAGEVFHIAAQVEHASGGLIIADSSSQPGAIVPMHCHHQPEVFYCVEGAYQFGTLGEQGEELWFNLPAGAAVYIPPNTPHAFSNPADRPARCLAFFNGTDVRGFFELGQPVPDREAALAAPFQPDLAELGSLLAEAAKHGMKF